jgi:deazaflavin-dependent oxidoreductase (nitroreductase family)
MPLPKRLARFNLVITNRVLGPFAKWLPGFAVVEHVGRRSRTVRHSPVNLFKRGDRYVIALTYGADSQWVRNVQAAGEFTVITRGRRVSLTEPELVHDDRRTLVPAPVGLVLGLVGVNDFLVSRAARAGGAPAPPPSPRGSAPPRSGPPARP